MRDFARIMEGLAYGGGEEKVVMIDATHLKAHRTASSQRVSKADQKSIRGIDSLSTGGLNTKLHAVSDGEPSRHHRFK